MATATLRKLNTDLADASPKTQVEYSQAVTASLEAAELADIVAVWRNTYTTVSASDDIDSAQPLLAGLSTAATNAAQRAVADLTDDALIAAARLAATTNQTPRALLQDGATELAVQVRVHATAALQKLEDTLDETDPEFLDKQEVKLQGEWAAYVEWIITGFQAL